MKREDSIFDLRGSFHLSAWLHITELEKINSRLLSVRLMVSLRGDS